MSLLEVKELSIYFGSRKVVDNVSFSLDEGQKLALVGESASGKTVTALSTLRLIENARLSGSIRFQGREVLTMLDAELHEMRGRDIAVIFQEPMSALNPIYTVGQQIVESLELHTPLRGDAAWKEAIAAMQRVGIDDAGRRARSYPHQLSGGQRQRAMIAMALACKPKLLIADEPTTALDVTIQAQILTLLRELVAEEDTALILITHDLGVVAGMCERVNVMYAGMFMETGSAEQLFETPRHPYTLGLLQSVPRLDATRRVKLQAIEGAPRDMMQPPSACPFQPRCRYEVDLSRQEVPPLVEIEPGHKIACFNPVPAEEWERTRVAATA